jgi:hypothetical protein
LQPQPPPWLNWVRRMSSDGAFMGGAARVESVPAVCQNCLPESGYE